MRIGVVTGQQRAAAESTVELVQPFGAEETTFLAAGCWGSPSAVRRCLGGVRRGPGRGQVGRPRPEKTEQPTCRPLRTAVGYRNLPERTTIQRNKRRWWASLPTGKAHDTARSSLRTGKACASTSSNATTACASGACPTAASARRPAQTWTTFATAMTTASVTFNCCAPGTTRPQDREGNQRGEAMLLTTPSM